MTVLLTQPSSRVKRFRLRVIRGVDEGADCSSSGVEMTVGSGEGNDLVLHDPSVSRHHLSLIADDRGVAVQDLGSTNGTVVDGVRLISGFLAPGSTIAIGETVLAFDSLEGDLEPAMSESTRFGGAVGSSVAMRRLFAVLERAAPTELSVLLEGETGTGKTVLAEAVHLASPRARGPFVVVDCGAIPRGLIESELFGHVRGAFTGADTTRTGLLEAADGGTVFLDEIGELPLELQPKLLRVLDRKQLARVGATQPVSIDVRVIAATNRDLRREVNAGRFRSDLWFRLNTVRVVVPPLRARREDIPLLVDHFHRQLSPDGADAPRALVDALMRGEWPGNVRELANAVERALVFDDASQWRDVPPPPPPAPEPVDSVRFDPSVSFRTAKNQATSAWERAYLADLMSRYGSNVTDAARAARMDRSYLRELLVRHGLLPGA